MSTPKSPIDRNHPLPAYYQLVEILTQEIRKQWQPGDRFPSQNELVDQYGVSCATVLRALVELEKRGLITRERGRGTFITPRAGNEQTPDQRTRVIGVVLSESWDQAELDPFYQEMICSLGRAASREEYSLLLLATDAMRTSRVTRFLNSRQASGLIFFNRSEVADATFTAIRQALPVVITDPPKESESDVCWVDVDSEAGIRLAMAQLLREGHSAIGLLNGEPSHPAYAARFETYRKCLEEKGIPFRQKLVEQSRDLSFESGYIRTKSLLKAEPTAILAANGRLTMGAVRALTDARLRIPDEISLIGYDDAPVFALTTPPITMVKQPIAGFADALVGTLLQLIRKGRATRQGLRLRPVLEERGSVAVPRTAAAK